MDRKVDKKNRVMNNEMQRTRFRKTYGIEGCCEELPQDTVPCAYTVVRPIDCEHGDVINDVTNQRPIHRESERGLIFTKEGRDSMQRGGVVSHE